MVLLPRHPSYMAKRAAETFHGHQPQLQVYALDSAQTHEQMRIPDTTSQRLCDHSVSYLPGPVYFMLSLDKTFYGSHQNHTLLV